MPQERLQKILSAAGVASRRVAESLIAEGRVRVNGEVVNELGARAEGVEAVGGRHEGARRGRSVPLPPAPQVVDREPCRRYRGALDGVTSSL